MMSQSYEVRKNDRSYMSLLSIINKVLIYDSLENHGMME
jgi:hypothetical protein